MKKYVLIAACCAFHLGSLFAQQVSQETMERIYEEVKTPYKYGLVIAPTDNHHKIDCPTVFRQGDKWLMTYVVYNGKGGTDGRGYETWLAESDNLLEWKTLGRLLSYHDGFWDSNQRGGFPTLSDMNWGGSYQLQTYKGRYWMTYIGGAGTGYEAVREPLAIGLAWTNKDIASAHEWESADKPLLSIHDRDAQWWEKLTEYKSTVYWDHDKKLGKPFVMFYNAGGVNPKNGLKGERVGIALSKDMKHWERYAGNPVFAHESSGTITGDAHIQKMGDVYVMFYFSAFNPTRSYKAYNTFAASYDLVHWNEWNGRDLIIPSKNYDGLFAHKSYVVKYNGVVYHFYCAVNNAEQRGIAVATSKPMGRSDVRFPKPEMKQRRLTQNLKDGWTSWLVNSIPTNNIKGQIGKNITCSLPHNWDDYYGYRQLTHGNLHGTAMYSKIFNLEKKDGKQYFLRFEGVGTYATIKVNGRDLGRHIGGRTTFTLDVTPAVHSGENTLEVKVEHPEMISDMPWVCGGCSSEWGFSEGSQPFGLFRPVVLEETDNIRIEPFGVHIWNDDKLETAFIDTEVRNYGTTAEDIEVVNKLSDADGRQVFRLVQKVKLQPGETRIIRQKSPIKDPERWSLERPYLYKLASMIKRNTKTTDEISMPYGFRTVSWPVTRKNGDHRFLLNGSPVFINGVCEYEHLFGQSHAFTSEQIASRVKQIKNAGFNAFRDAHQPHNLEYQNYWDKEGILWWPQFSAHIWYDTPEFRNNFKTLLRQWVKERRNSPSVVLWGLQNESTLPADFAKECSEIIRKMDPTSRSMRPVTTCNGGDGTDWNVVQNWSGTYGGDVSKYDRELVRKDQLLNGEYGAWRSLGLHTEPGDTSKIWSENNMCDLLEKKIRLAEQVKDSVCGQFLWVYSSHDNPGRRQPDEGYRKIDKVGPFNYKGLVTPWEEPVDAYYLYRAYYVPASKDPMVYLVSHTWADRFKTGRRRATLEAYSNCDSVLLYNGVNPQTAVYLGKKKKSADGGHFLWENRDVRYNVLKAVGYVKGKPVAEDVLVLNGLEQTPDFDQLYQDVRPVLKGADGYNYLYRINCGGDDYTDSFGQVWKQDNMTVSHSWAEDFKNLCPYLASQRTISDPIRGTTDWPLFQHFRFGRQKLDYRLNIPDGRYRVELYFTEPWHGVGGSESTDCEGIRIFDVAVNDSVILDDLDIWSESGYAGVCKKVVNVTVKGGILRIHFPEVKAGQVVISAIAVASEDRSLRPVELMKTDWSWAKVEYDCVVKTPKEALPEDENSRKSIVYQAEQAKITGLYKLKEIKKAIGVVFDKGSSGSITWPISTGLAQVYALRFKYMNVSGDTKTVRLKFVDVKGVVLRDEILTLPATPEKWKLVNTTTGSFINAGHYTVQLSAADMDGLVFESLEVQ